MINVAIIGVGSFTKALLEGVSFYIRHPEVTTGLAHPYIGPYQVSDLNFVAAFDIDEEKVGQKLHQAISFGRNVSFPIGESLPFSAIVHKGPSLASVIPELGIRESLDVNSDISRILKETETQVVINLLPSGSNLATAFYADQALMANCHFVNAIPTPLAILSEWKRKFQSKNLVLLGDDIKSQFGATMLNRLIIQALKQRGIHIHHSHQHNRGGNMDHLNLVYRHQEKEHSKKKTMETQIMGFTA
jgi:myo-inositol-1-phosphate synthase